MWDNSRPEEVVSALQAPYIKKRSGQRAVALVDLDSTIVDTWGGVMNIRRLDKLPPLIAPTEWNLRNLPEDDRQYVFRLFEDATFYRNLKPLPGVVSDLYWIAEEYDIVYITGRGWNRALKTVSEDIHKATRDWIYQSQVPEGVLLYTATDNKGGYSRSVFGKRIAFAIEDSPASAYSYEAHAVHVYLISQLYNLSIEDDIWFTRVGSVSDVVEDLRKIGTLTVPARMSEDQLFRQFMRQREAEEEVEDVGDGA